LSIRSRLLSDARIGSGSVCSISRSELETCGKGRRRTASADAVHNRLTQWMWTVRSDLHESSLVPTIRARSVAFRVGDVDSQPKRSWDD